MINLSENYLLFIEPDKDGPPTVPIDDEFVQVARRLLQMSVVTIVYKQHNHITLCGRASDNCQRELPNGMFVHSLMPYYLLCYRKYIPESEMVKFKNIATTLLKLPKDFLNVGSVAAAPIHSAPVQDDEMPKLKQVVKQPVKEEPPQVEETFSLEERMAKLVEVVTNPTKKTSRK